MKERIKGRKLLRLFLVCVLGTALLSGCGGMNRYQTMELETETEIGRASCRERVCLQV